MTQLQAIRQFLNAISSKKVIISRRRGNWGMYIEKNIPTIIIPKDPNEKDDDFRNDFISRYPCAINYMDVTISILHEMGHYFTRNQFLDFDPSPYENYTGTMHFKNPEEIAATDWAIAWLNSNQEKVREFENNFIG